MHVLKAFALAVQFMALLSSAAFAWMLWYLLANPSLGTDGPAPNTIEYRSEGEVSISVVSAAEPIPPFFERLGWDVASRSFTPGFECSPLSCNGLATDTGINEFCLLKSEEEAVAFARRCAAEQPEPGTYFVIEIWRELIAANSAAARAWDAQKSGARRIIWPMTSFSR